MSHVRAIRSTAIALSLLLICNLGCFHRHVSRYESGNYVDGKLFAQITPGKTTGGWVKSLLGEPSSTRKTDAGSEIWEWAYSETKTVDGQLLVLSDNSTVTYHRKAMVEVKDGIVTNKWFDDRNLKERENLN